MRLQDLYVIYFPSATLYSRVRHFVSPITITDNELCCCHNAGFITARYKLVYSTYTSKLSLLLTKIMIDLNSTKICCICAIVS